MKSGVHLVCIVFAVLLQARGLRLHATKSNDAPSSLYPSIPKKILFNFRENIFENPDKYPVSLQNLRRTLAIDTSLKYEFYDDLMCAAVINRTHSEELAHYFTEEQSGAYKSDMCRLAMLYEHGGYYMDNDLELVSNFLELIPTNVSVTSVVSLRGFVFQAFLGSTPGHPLIKDAMDRTLHRYKQSVPKHYIGGDHPWSFPKHDKRDEPLGPMILSESFRSWLRIPKIRGGYVAQSPGADGAYFFQEREDLEMFGVTRRTCCTPANQGRCNIIVVDIPSRKQVFWSRMIQDYMKCPEKQKRARDHKRHFF